MSRSNKTSEWKKKLAPQKRALIIKWVCESTAKQYDDFIRRSEIRKLKNQNRLKKIEETKSKEARELLVK